MMPRESSYRVEDKHTVLCLTGKSARKAARPHRRGEQQETQVLVAALSLAAIGVIILISMLIKLLGFENESPQCFPAGLIVALKGGDDVPNELEPVKTCPLRDAG